MASWGGGNGPGNRLSPDVDESWLVGIPTRDWLAIKYGFETIEIRSPEFLESYVQEMRKTLLKLGINLCPTPMCPPLICTELSRVKQTMERYVWSVKREKDPILFLIDDYKPEGFIKQYCIDNHNEVYLFSATGQELDRARQIRSFCVQRGWCQEFVDFADLECADFNPSLLKARQPVHEAVSFEPNVLPSFGQDSNNSYHNANNGDVNDQQTIRDVHNRLNRPKHNEVVSVAVPMQNEYPVDVPKADYAQAEQFDRNPHQVQKYNYDNQFPQLKEDQPQYPVSEASKSRTNLPSGIPSANDIRTEFSNSVKSERARDNYLAPNVSPLRSQGQLENYCHEPYEKNADTSSVPVQKNTLAVTIEVVREVVNLAQMLVPGSNDLAQNVTGPRLFARLACLFDTLVDNTVLLQMINAIMREPIEGVAEDLMRLVGELVTSRLLYNLISRYGKISIDDDPDNRTGWGSHMYDFLRECAILFNGCINLFPDRKSIDLDWRLYCELLHGLPAAYWNTVDVIDRQWLENAVTDVKCAILKLHSFNDIGSNTVALENRNIDQPRTARVDQSRILVATEAHSSRSMLPSEQNQPDVDFEPIWVAFEKLPPPDDFRLLAEIPVIKDLYNPVQPYLRRSKSDCAYDNAEHYLDVQFRLLREDMISPLRDGIANHKLNGTSRYEKRLLADGTSSDLAVFDVQRVEGIQIKWNTGESFRYARLTRASAMHPAVLRHARFGQVVCLSNDGFVKDFHIAVVVERDDESLMRDGRIGMTFPDGDNIKKHCEYVMAEPSSYLEAYQHVLKVIKKISKFSPLPMERYLVHCKTNIRRPLYMRLSLTDSDIEEDHNVEKYYKGIRSLERPIRQKKRNAQSKARKRRSKSSNPYYGSSSDSEGCLSELDTPIINIRSMAINEEERENIVIDGQRYKIDKMLEDYKPSHLDESQRLAVISALTQEMSIIQGPPGTGKTFIGVEIVRSLLANRTKFGNRQPILLVCYTNTALDQFLEKIIDKVGNDIATGVFSHVGPIAVRLGSKSESEKLSRARILRRDVIADYKDFAVEEERMYTKLMGTKRKASAALFSMAYCLGASRTQLMSYEAIAPALSEEHRLEFATWMHFQKDSHGEPLNFDEALASWLLDKSFAKTDNTLSAKDSSPLKLTIDDDDSDFETDGSIQPGAVGLDEEEGMTLNDMFKKINMDSLAAEQSAHSLDEDEQEELYEIDSRWDMANAEQGGTKNMQLLGRNLKLGSSVTVTGGGRFRNTQVQRAQVAVDVSIIRAMEDSRDAVLRARSISPQELKEVTSLFTLTKQRRWELYAYWRKMLRIGMRQQLPVQIKEFQRTCEKADKARMKMDCTILGRSLIIGATTTGAAKSRDFLEKLGCKILVVEEAAEVLEAHILSAMLPTLEHAIFIGDHQQLRPNPAVFELAREYGLNISMFERMIMNKLPYNTLTQQHRMNTMITKAVVRPHFYNGLVDAPSVTKYPNVTGMEKSLFFWTHDHPEHVPFDSASFRNDHEVKMVVELADYICKQQVYKQSDITVIATYSAQTEALRSAIISKFGKNKEGTAPAIAVETVDSYQGRENKIIIVSLVRSRSETIGFLSVSNRVCVALTRAQHGMYIVGNLDHLSRCSRLWSDVSESLRIEDCVGYDLPLKCKTHGNTTIVIEPHDFRIKATDGGCSLQCGQTLPCTHECFRRCHPVDDHKFVLCLEPCKRRCSNADHAHACNKLCHEVCGPCMQMVDVPLPCGHSTTAPCSKAADAVCHNRCEIVLACQHQCREICGKPCTVVCIEHVPVEHACGHTSSIHCNLSAGLIECDSACRETLPCGHACAEKCGRECTFECEQLVSRTLSCGHKGTMHCHQSSTDHPCQTPIEQVIKECGHMTFIPCAFGSDPSMCSQTCQSPLPCGHKCVNKCGDCHKSGRHSCVETCGRLLPCGHLCINRCGEPCKECSASCVTSCVHQRCGNGLTVGREVIAYGRVCHQLCALCPKPCDNICEHRGCTLPCWEVCDVKACEEVCRKLLPCNHACLGLCGEKCPAVCGTCNKGLYLATVDVLKEKGVNVDQKGSRIHRIIELPLCGHRFPAMHLDEVVRKCKDFGTRPSCPKLNCGRPIEQVKRYTKIIKKIVLDQYKSKEVFLSRTSNACVNFNKLLEQLRATKEAIQKSTAVKKEITRSNRLASMIGFCIDLCAEAKIDNSDKLSYWNDIVRCLQYLTRIYLLMCVPGIPHYVREPVEMETFCNDFCVNGAVYKTMVDIVDETLTFLEKHIGCGMSGIIMPMTRFLLQKITFYYTIAKLAMVLHRRKLDLNPIQAKELSSRAVAFCNSGPTSNFEGIYSKFGNYIYETVLMPIGMQSDWAEFEYFCIPPF